MSISKEFKEFIDKYKIAALAVAFVLGAAVNDFIQSLVQNIVMPFIDPLIEEGTWQTATFNLGPIVIKWGAFLSSLLHFIIIAFVVFMVIRSFTRIKKISLRDLKSKSIKKLKI